MVLYRIQTTESTDLHGPDLSQTTFISCRPFLSLADSVANISRSITSGDRLLEIHNHGLVCILKETVFKLFKFLNIDCPRDYVQQKCFRKYLDQDLLLTGRIPEEMKLCRAVLNCIPDYSFESLMKYLIIIRNCT